MKKLPKPKHRLGYPERQLKEILKKLNIGENEFNKAFGVNTMSVSKSGELIFYKCDVEKALHNLRHKLGKWHMWD